MSDYQIKIVGDTPLLYNRIEFMLEAELPEFKSRKAESKLAYEKRIWQNRAVLDDDGNAIIKYQWISPMLENSYRVMTPGSKVTKFFKLAVRAQNSIVYKAEGVPVKLEDMEEFLAIVQPQKGKVPLIRPQVPIPWFTILNISVLEESITEEIIFKTLDYAGKFNGIGDWRAQFGGNFGMFTVDR